MDKVKKNFEDRNIEFEYFTTVDKLLSAIKQEVERHESIGIGNSDTLKELKVSELVRKMNKVVYDKTNGNTSDEILYLKKKGMMSDCYISSCNAITEDGKIVNVDHSGNRVAAITFGPDRVLIIAGINKLVKNEQEGISRSLKVATPLNALRAKIASPCSLGLPCVDCIQEVRVCNYISVVRGQNLKGRMKVFMIDDSFGF